MFTFSRRFFLNNRLSFSCIMLFFMIFLIASTATSKTLNIVTIQLAPFGFITEDGKPEGMMYEIGNLIAEEAKIKYTNKVIPYARTAKVIGTGNADFVLRFTNEELDKTAISVVAVAPMKTIVVGLAGEKFNSLESLHGKTIANLRGAIFDKEFTADAKILKYNVNDYDHGLKMLLNKNKRLDGVIGTNVGIYYTANKLNYTPEQLCKPLFLSSKDFLLLFSKKTADKKTLKALKDATLKLQKKGAIIEIIKKYMGKFNIEI